MKKMLVVLLLLSSLNIYGLNPAAAASQDTLVQVATIDALLGGLYDGVATIDSLKAHGDTGIGTFDQLDGEMIVLDGKAYKVRNRRSGLFL
jgi:acetolactate decarboxylase